MDEALIIRNKKNDYQVLSEYFAGEIGEEELTEHQQERLLRVRATHSLLLNFSSTSSIVEKMKKVYYLSEATVFRDIQLTQQLFGDIRKSNKSFKRSIAEEMALETWRMAKDKGDLRGMAAANRNYIEATGCNVEDPDMPDFSKLKPNVYPIIIAPQVEELLDKLISQQGPLNLSKIMDENAETIKFEPTSGADTEGD